AGPKGLKAGPIFDEVIRHFRQELDYHNEATNQRAFSRLHEGEARIHIPNVFDALSAHRVLTTSWAEGISLDQASQCPEPQRRSYAETLWRFVFRGNLVG